MCDFTDTNADIKSQLIAGSGDERATLKELSEPRVTLGKLQQFAKTLDNIQSEDYNPPNSNCQQLRRDSPWLTHPTGCQHKKQTPPSRTCFNCGVSWPHPEESINAPPEGLCRMISGPQFHHAPCYVPNCIVTLSLCSKYNM